LGKRGEGWTWLKRGGLGERWDVERVIMNFSWTRGRLTNIRKGVGSVGWGKLEEGHPGRRSLGVPTKAKANSTWERLKILRSLGLI